MTVIGRYILATSGLAGLAFHTDHPVVGGFLVYAVLVMFILGAFHHTSSAPTPKQ